MKIYTSELLNLSVETINPIVEDIQFNWIQFLKLSDKWGFRVLHFGYLNLFFIFCNLWDNRYLGCETSETSGQWN